MQYLGILATVFGTNYAFWDKRNAFLGRNYYLCRQEKHHRYAPDKNYSYAEMPSRRPFRPL